MGDIAEQLIDELAEQGKRWNADKKCIEDISQPIFKMGDKVRVKDSISNRTHKSIAINECIGKKLTVKEYSVSGFVVTKVDDYEYHFHEDWLEPYTNELKKVEKHHQIWIKRTVR